MLDIQHNAFTARSLLPSRTCFSALLLFSKILKRLSQNPQFMWCSENPGGPLGDRKQTPVAELESTKKLYYKDTGTPLRKKRNPAAELEAMNIF